VAHELAHSYWGNLAQASYDDPAGAWLHEGFAEYAAWRALGGVRGESERVRGVRMNTIWYLFARPGNADGAIVSASIQNSPAFVPVVYHKGSSVLWTLENEVGSLAFNDALRSLFDEPERGLSIARLSQSLTDVAGFDATAFVDQWLEQSGYPELLVGATLGAAGEADVTVHSSGAFVVRLPLWFSLQDGTTVVETLTVGPGTTQAHFALPAPAWRLQADPQWTLVRLCRPTTLGDLTADGRVDGADLSELGLGYGGHVPTERRQDGGFDPWLDINDDHTIDFADVVALRNAPAR
jgi:hypothetical protein